MKKKCSIWTSQWYDMGESVDYEGEYFVFGVNNSYKSPEIRSGTPNYFVAPSSLLAMLTLGERYEASIL